MLKNPTTRQVALITALFVLIAFLICNSLLWNYTFIATNLGVFIAAALLFFSVTYLIIMYFVRRFIYRRIKLIYKNIHRFKRAKGDKLALTDINERIIDDVEKEVSEWVENQENEIQYLKSLEEYRRDYLGNVSHELKTPIFNIQGYIHTLLDGGLYDENINQNYLQRAAKNTERLQVIVEDLDTISKLESGKLMLEKGVFDIRELAQSAMEELEIMANDNHIDLIFKEGADRHYLVNADIESIRQVFVNLITNSIKYGKKHGVTKVSFYDMDRHILVEIADNGIGIKEEDIPHVFDRFYRVDKSRSRIAGGSGLGLSIVKHIIEAHQQTINVRSTPDLGSTFGFTLEKST